jgi:IS5 family transposase
VVLRLKAHIDSDLDSGLVHTLSGTAANVSNIGETHKLLHGEEEMAFADAGYPGIEKREQLKECKATWYVAMKRSKRKQLNGIIERKFRSSFHKARIAEFAG